MRPGRLDKIAWLFNRLRRFEHKQSYRDLVDIIEVGKLCRWPIGVVGVVSILLYQQNQGRDALLSFIDAQDQGIGQFVRIGLFLGMAVLWAVVSWYFPRLRLYLWSAGAGSNDRVRKAATVIPRLLGTTCLLMVGIATWRARVDDSPPAVPVILFVMAGLFYPATVYRRARLQAGGGPVLARVRGLGAIFRARAEVGASGEKGPRKVLQQYARGFALVAVLAVFWVVVMVVLFLSPVSFAQFIGAPTAALIAASFWTALTFGVGVLSDRTRFPITAALVLWAVLISPWTDNHVVQPLPSYAPPRPSLSRAFTDWLAVRETAGGQPLPVFFVYAEGGGIRAAYWTAAVLGELADENPAFPDHLFAVSGVSGGSWGATVYTGVRAWVGRQDSFRTSPLSQEYGQTVNAVHQVLRNDFLSPVMAGLLLRDPAQWFIPFLHLPDRGRAFEQAWEIAWRKALGDDAMARPFLDLRGPGLPHLFLGSTWVERGTALVISDLVLPSQTNDFFSMSTREIKTSTAAHLSSRFFLLNPAATIEHGVPMHLVDGGYYENSGAETLLRVIDEAVSVAAKEGRAIRPIVIAIHNDVTLPPEYPPPITRATEISAPVTAAVNVLMNNAPRAEAVLQRWRSPAGTPLKILQFNLAPTGKAVPLGWSLSEAAMRAMDDQLIHRNQCQREQVKAILAATAR